MKISEHSDGDAQLKEILEKYCNVKPTTQDEMMSQLYRNRKNLKPYQIFMEVDRKTLMPFMGTWLKGMPVDGRLVMKATFSQNHTEYGKYKRLQFKEGEAIVVVSASLDNTYLLFGYKETTQTIQRQVDKVEVFGIERKNERNRRNS